MKIKTLAVLATTALLSSLNANAQDSYDNYIVSFQLLSPSKNEVLSMSALLADNGGHSKINRKSYAITECIETSQKKTRTFKGKEFLSGYSYSVNPRSGLVEFTEYGIDDAKYKDYDTSQCFKGEVKQIKFTSTQKVKVGSKEFQEFLLPSGNFLNVAIYKEDRL